ncbi:NAD(P)H-binding protein [Streptomyces sp. CA-106110]|uniref:NAD(P)H-binding protein n=1 Tax=Streptomyces sp. CA-106110 TaxID=3240044 RepID=UPI003D920C60
MILNTRATGNLGRPLVAEPAAKGATVGALTRTPATTRVPDGVEVCDSVQPDVDGVTAPSSSTSPPSGNAPRRCWMAARRQASEGASPSPRWSLPATPDAERGSTAAIHQELGEAVETAFGQLAYLRPGAFASHAVQCKPQLQASNVVRDPYTQSSTAPIVDADLAALALRALVDDELIGRKPSLTGPEGLTATQRVEILGQVPGRWPRYEDITSERAGQAMLSHNPWVHEAAIDSLPGYLARTVGRPAWVRGEVERMLGRPARTVAQWAADHAAAFQN